MVEGKCVERARMSSVVDAAICSHEQEPRILFIGGKVGKVVEMDKTQAMASANLFALLSNKRQHSMFLRKRF